MRSKQAVTGLLIGCLMLGSIQRTRAFIGECITGMVIVGVGIVMYVGLKKMCQRLPPLNNPPQPPTCPSTNAPPATNHIVSLANPVTITVDDGGMEAYDVSGAQFQNTDPNGGAYTRLFRGSFQSTTNLSQWQCDARVVGWMSYQWVLMVLYDGSGSPIATNISPITQGRSTNSVSLPIDPRSQARFFRTAGF